MKRIYKFKLSVQHDQTVLLPNGYRILSVGEQQGDITMWVMVDPDLPTTECYIRLYGTGHSIKEDMGYENIYLDTVIMSNGLVWHVFEMK